MRVQKVLIYATSARGLLVFDEPEFPDVPLQVPGGMVEPGEGLLSAARREFVEETGLCASEVFQYLGDQEVIVSRPSGRLILQRHLFHAPLVAPTSEVWTHAERQASDGSGAILFHFFWLALSEAQTRLGLDMSEGVIRLDSDRPVIPLPY
jgi:8-oxo-dGTP pyrophosphatase MutT (NUDIX family)